MIDWETFWADRDWRPLEDHHRSAEEPQLLRAGERWAFGFWGPRADFLPDDGAGATWRNAQESADEAPLDFEPREYATVGDDERAELMAD